MHTLAFLGTFLTSIVSEAQMKRMLLITPLISILLLLPSRVSGQEWRGIQLLRSNCDDVKRALGIDRCEYPRTTYRLNDETVTVSFESCPCPIVCYHESSGWNVPPGTVGSIIRQLHKPLPIANFDVSSRKWTTQHTDFIGQVIYDNKDDGIRLSAIEGAVVTITFYPPLERFKDLLSQSVFLRHGMGRRMALNLPHLSPTERTSR